MANILIELDEHELDFLTELIGSSVSSFERIVELNKATGRRTKPEYIENCNWQKELMNKLNKYLTNGK